MPSKLPGPVGLHIDATTIELFASFPGKAAPIGARYYTPKVPLEAALTEFKGRVPAATELPIQISTSYGLHLFERRAGDSPAMLVTGGFEGWPFLRQPGREDSLSLLPVRSVPLLSSDLVFGISERTDSQGKVVAEPQDEEISFLISKLQFSGVKSVSVCFLHSDKNPANERKVVDKLKEAGFVTNGSHDCPTPANEVPRWWRAFTDLYLKSAFDDHKKAVQSTLEKQGWSSEKVSWLEQHPVDAIWSRDMALQKQAADRALEGVLYFGFDGWKAIWSNGLAPAWSSDLGPVACRKPNQFEFRAQPTCELILSEFGVVIPGSLQLGNDPGPARWGRSLRPTLIDALLPKEFDLGTGFPDSEPPRATDSLNALSRSAKISRDVLRDSILEFIDDQLSYFLFDRKGKWELDGPLAPLLKTELSSTLGSLKLMEDCEFASARSASWTGAQ